MKKMNSVLTFSALALVACFQWAHATESGIRMIVLTDKAEKTAVNEAAAQSRERAKSRDAMRQQILEDIRRQRLEMANNGFVIGTDALMTNKDKYPDELIKHQAITGNTYDSVLPDFAYPARNLTDSPFRKGRLLGFMPLRSGDNKVHEVVWAFSIRGLGKVIVEELSYATVPNVTIAVAEPSGNIQINGNPGTYMVMTDKKRKRGVTTIEFMTAGKLFTLTAYKPVMRDSKRFKRLIKLAESLY